LRVALDPRRLLLWGLVPLVAAAALAAVRLAQARATLEEARTLLLAGEIDRAAADFARLRRVPFLRARAEAGWALAQALTGGDPGGTLSAEGLSPFDARALLDLARRTRPPGARRALATLLERSGERRAALDLAVLELDSGHDGAARRRVDQDPALFAPRGLGREVVTVLDLRQAGPVTIVRDRSGRLLGHRDGRGALVLAEEVDPALVPDALRGAELAPAVLAAAAPSASADDPAANVNPPGLRVSLDLELQRLALTALGPARGSVVLLDPYTGGVLAAVSDGLTTASGGTPAFEQRREPASIAKVITVAAALRAGLDPDEFIRHLDCRGAERIGHGIVWCSYAAGPLAGLDQAMAISCNMAFARLGLAAGRAALVDELHRWGFDRDFALAPAGRVKKPGGDLRQLADLAIGLEATDITPLHGALLAAVLADDGRMPEPALVMAEEGPMGLEPRPRPRLPPREVVDPAMLAVLGHALQAVPLYGTAAGVAPRDFPVAMKTGTAAEWRLGYHANYVGVAPWPKPRVAFSVRVTHAPTSSHVNRMAREVVARLLAGLRARMQKPE
jgi:hypothetical protein